MTKKLPRSVVIRNLGRDDELYIQACEKLGIEVFATYSSNEDEERSTIAQQYSRLSPTCLKTAYQRQISIWISHLFYLTYTKWFQIKNKAKIELRLSKFPGQYIFFKVLLGSIFPFLRPYLRILTTHWDKELYLRKLFSSQVPVPEIYQTLRDNQEPTELSPNVGFPCICKPIYGTGGFGVMIANSKSDIEKLFSYEENLQNFSSLAVFYRNKTDLGYRNYIFNSGFMGGRYLFQKYIEGSIFSISGALVKGKVSSVFCNEIYSVPNSYCAEQGFSWPIPNEIEKRMIEISQQAVQVLEYPDGPFMIDFVLSKQNELFIIDASPRASLVAARLSHWVFKDNLHAENLLASHWGQHGLERDQNQKGRPIYWQRFPFPKGRYKSVTYPDFQRAEIIYIEKLVESGSQVNEPRMDRQMVARGAMVTTGATLQIARDNWNRIFEEVKWELEN